MRHRLTLIPVVALFAIATGACVGSPLMSELDVSTTIIRPNGTTVDPSAHVGFTLSRRADVAVELLALDGRAYELRGRMTRAPDRYEIRFDGTVPLGTEARRVVPNGQYVLRVSAEDGAGARTERQVTLTVADADTTPVEVVDLQTDHERFSPNGDGKDDDLRITYRLTKEAESTVYVTDDRGAYYAIDPWKKRNATLQSHLWDGTTGGRVFGGKLLPDGRYYVHVDARDAAGNLSTAVVPVLLENAGTPRLEIVDARFTPNAVILGGTLDVRVVVKNTGTVPIHSWGPPPGYTYAAPAENFASIRDPMEPAKPAFFERPGVWRIGVTWQNAPQTFPLRWGLFPPAKNADGSDNWESAVLMPGATMTVEGHIRVGVKEDSRQVRFSAGVIQEGVGFPGGRVGEQVIQVGW